MTAATALSFTLAPALAQAADTPPAADADAASADAASADAASTDGTNEDAASADAARVLALSDEGAALYERADYRRALEKFIAAYAIGQDPNLLFNMGRCYQQLGDNTVAEEKYRAFIADPGADPAGVERAKALLERLHEPVVGASEAPALVPIAEAPVAPTRDSQPSGEPSTLRSILPWATLGAGVACLTAGTTLYLLGAADHGRVTDSRGYDDPNSVSPLTEARARELVSSGDTKKTLGGVGLGLGGALLATSIVLFVTDPTVAPTAPSGRAAPLGVALGPSGGSLSLIGSF